MIYLVDGTAINDRTDWKHRINPIDAGRMEQRVPGLSDVYVVKQPPLPASLTVTGFFEGSGSTVQDACNQLIYNVRLWISRIADSTLRSVTVHSTVFDQCELVEFGTLEELTAVATTDSGGDPAFKVRQAVRFTWRPLTPATLTPPTDDGGGA